MATFQASSKAADAPDLDAIGGPGFFDARFDGTALKTMKTGLYVKDPVNGDPKLEWQFTLLDDDGEVIYDGGDPFEVSKLTGVGFNVASKTVPAEVKVLQALLTPAEFAAFKEGEGTDEEQLIGRIVQVELFVKENGWPGVGSVLPARKARKSRSA